MKLIFFVIIVHFICSDLGVNSQDIPPEILEKDYEQSHQIPTRKTEYQKNLKSINGNKDLLNITHSRIFPKISFENNGINSNKSIEFNIFQEPEHSEESNTEIINESSSVLYPSLHTTATEPTSDSGNDSVTLKFLSTKSTIEFDEFTVIDGNESKFRTTSHPEDLSEISGLTTVTNNKIPENEDLNNTESSVVSETSFEDVTTNKKINGKSAKSLIESTLANENKKNFLVFGTTNSDFPDETTTVNENLFSLKDSVLTYSTSSTNDENETTQELTSTTSSSPSVIEHTDPVTIFTNSPENFPTTQKTDIIQINNRTTIVPTFSTETNAKEESNFNISTTTTIGLNKVISTEKSTIMITKTTRKIVLNKIGLTINDTEGLCELKKWRENQPSYYYAIGKLFRIIPCSCYLCCNTQVNKVTQCKQVSIIFCQTANVNASL